MAADLTELDAIDYKLVQLLRQDARRSFRDLASEVHLSPAATTARVHSLEESEVITGYQAQINMGLLGRQTKAIVRLTSSHTTTPSVTGAEKFAANHPAIRTTFRVLGDCDVIFYVEAVDLQELDRLVSDLGRYGITNTTMVVSVVENDPVLD